MAIPRGAQKGRLEGFEQTISFLKKLGNTSDKLAQGMIEDLTRRVARISQTLVPVDTGKLKGSMTVFPDGKNGWTIQYGPNMNDPELSAPYAVYVHEIDRNYKHGTWKYLENAFGPAHEEFRQAVGGARLVGAERGAFDTNFQWLPSPTQEASQAATGGFE